MTTRSTPMANNRLTPSMERLLGLLISRPGLTCSQVGEALWMTDGSPKAIARSPQHFALPAGRLLKRAIDQGLVEDRPKYGQYRRRDGTWGTYFQNTYHLTKKGTLLWVAPPLL